jgi:hypothetical protein
MTRKNQGRGGRIFACAFAKFRMDDSYDGMCLLSLPPQLLCFRKFASKDSQRFDLLPAQWAAFRLLLHAGEAVGTAFLFAVVLRLIAAPFYVAGKQIHGRYLWLLLQGSSVSEVPAKRPDATAWSSGAS